MKNTLRIFILATSAVLGTTAFAQQKSIDTGKQEFEMSCAICHGLDAKGEGMVAEALKVKPTDLTLLTKKMEAFFQSITLQE